MNEAVLPIDSEIPSGVRISIHSVQACHNKPVMPLIIAIIRNKLPCDAYRGSLVMANMTPAIMYKKKIVI